MGTLIMRTWGGVGLGKIGGGPVWSPEPQLLVPTQVNRRDFESEKRLRKDLKRTKALLADAQLMLDHLKNSAPSKREIAQLKNQVSPESTWLIQAQQSLPFPFSFSLSHSSQWLVSPWEGK